MNVIKYTANGMIQRNGTDARFSRIWFVTASMRADGTNAAANQNRRERHAGAATFSWYFTRDSRWPFFQTSPDAANTISVRVAYPASQDQLWVRTPIRGSINKGKLRSAIRLPALLIA